MDLAAAVVACVALAPMLFVARMAIEAGWTTFASLVFRERVAVLLFNTVGLIVLTVPICAVIAVGLAWIVVRSTMPGRRLLGWLAIAPLAIPAFVHSYAWSGLFPGLGGIGGGVLVSTLAYFPFLYLPIVATLERLDPALEDVAASMGLGPWPVFRRVVLPQLRMALCGGALLVATHLLAEYALFVMMRFDTFTTAIVEQFQSGVGGTSAIMLALVLISACVTLLVLEALVRGDRHYARVGSGAARQREPVSLGSLKVPCMILSFLWVGLALVVPLLTLGRWLWIGGFSAWGHPDVGSALLQTLGLAAAGALLATLAAFPAAWASVRRGGSVARLAEAASYFVS